MYQNKYLSILTVVLTFLISMSTPAAALAAQAARSDSAASKTYTVKKGDCLWNIAASELGNGSRWPEIYECNKDKIDNPRLIYAGQELVLPAA